MENVGFFGRLPGELRNRIYEHVLISDYAMLLAPVYNICNGQTEFSSENFNPRTMLPTLTWVCRAIREETPSIYCNGNIFLLQSQPKHGRYFSGIHLRKVKLDPRTLKDILVPIETWSLWKQKLEEEIFGTGRTYSFDLINAGQQDKRLPDGIYVKVTIK